MGLMGEWMESVLNLGREGIGYQEGLGREVVVMDEELEAVVRGEPGVVVKEETEAEMRLEAVPEVGSESDSDSVTLGRRTEDRELPGGETGPGPERRAEGGVEREVEVKQEPESGRLRDAPVQRFEILRGSLVWRRR